MTIVVESIRTLREAIVYNITADAGGSNGYLYAGRRRDRH